MSTAHGRFDIRGGGGIVAFTNEQFAGCRPSDVVLEEFVAFIAGSFGLRLEQNSAYFQLHAPKMADFGVNEYGYYYCDEASRKWYYQERYLRI